VWGRKGCSIRCVAVVLSLVLLYPLWLLALTVIPITLGVLFPWQPPVAEDAPGEAILRVLAPEDEKYRIEWGSGFSKVTDEGEQVDPEIGYRDYPVRAEAVDHSGTYDIRIYAGDRAEDINGYPADKQGISLEAVLFIGGEYANCRGTNQWLTLTCVRPTVQTPRWCTRLAQAIDTRLFSREPLFLGLVHYLDFVSWIHRDAKHS
jgi:hypothetical protein